MHRERFVGAVAEVDEKGVANDGTELLALVQPSSSCDSIEAASGLMFVAGFMARVPSCLLFEPAWRSGDAIRRSNDWIGAWKRLKPPGLGWRDAGCSIHL
jgi:hypothetical protein